MKLSLVVLNAGKSAGQAIPITLTQFVIGRDPQCNLRPGSVLISKRHCAVLIKGDQVAVRDFDSTNGTFVNEEQIKGEVPLKAGDILKVGPLQFRVTIEGLKPASPSKTPLPASTLVKKPTPLPATKTSGSEDESAALLLGLDDEAFGASFGSTDAMGVPDGSTIMDLPINLPPIQEESEVDAAPPEPIDPPTKKMEPAKKPEPAKKNEIQVGTAQSAAKAILEKWNKRSR